MKNNDTQLINRTLEGDDSAFAELVEKYQKQVHALVWRKIGDFHIAEEITQDTFLKAYNKLAALKQSQSFASWLYVIATSRCNSWLHKKYRRTQLMQDIDTLHPQKTTYSEHVVEENERIAEEAQRDVVKKLLAKLGESERTVMTLHYFGEMSCSEIGRFMGVSTNTIKSRLRRAQQRLQKEETMIREALDNFQISPYLTENVMREVSRIEPVTPSSSKPLVPLAISAASAILVVLLIGFGAQNLLSFQKPYSLESTSERTIEIVESQIVLKSPIKPVINNQVGSSNVLSQNDGLGRKTDTQLFAAEQSDAVKSPTSGTQWGQTNGPYGGSIRTLFATPEGILLAGTGAQGIFRSTDLGNSWSPVTVEITEFNEGYDEAVWTFAQKEDTIYVSMSSGLYASTDIGKTWHYVSTEPQTEAITGIIIIGNRIYISTYPGGRREGGVWYSDDAKSWKQMNEGLVDGRIRVFANIGTTLVVGTNDGGAYRRKAADNSWHPINSIFDVQPNKEGQIGKSHIPESAPDLIRNLHSSSRIRIDSFAVMDNLLYMGAISNKVKGLFRSDDEGDSWTRVTAEEMDHTVEAMDVFGSTLYASTFGGGVFRSDDKGDSWIPVSEGMTDQVVTALVTVDRDTVFAGTGEVGVFKTEDGGNSWKEVNTGIISTSVVDLEVLGDRIYALTLGRLLYSENGGESWESIEIPEIPPKPIKFSYSEISALNGKLYVSATRSAPNSHGGTVAGIFQLDEQNNALTEVKTDREMYAIECMHIEGTTFYVGTQEQGVFLWNEGWESWLNIGLESHFITDISLYDANIYVRTDTGDVYRHKHDGNTWELTREIKENVLFAQSRQIDNKLYVLAAGEGLIRSTDEGNSWIQLNRGIEHVSIETVEIDTTNFYIGTTQHGVYKWHHKDEKWEQLGSLNRPVQTLAISGSYLYAGTSAGVYRIALEK